MHHEHSQSTPEQDLYTGLVQADEEQESLRTQKDADFIFSAYHPFLQNRIPRSATRCSMESACEFGAWSQCVHVRKQERCKDPKTNHSRHEFSWSRDQKTKPIQFAFKHYTDCKKYIQQYRYDHTYGLCMPPEKTSAEVTVVQGEEGHEDKPPSGHKARSTPTSASQSRGINRHNSDPSLLELAHRYKLAPSVLREAREQSTLKARPDPAQGSGDSEAEPPKVPCPTTNLSCVVPKEATRSVATMLPFAAVTAAPKKGKTSPPSGQSDPKENGQRTNQQVKVPVMVGKAVKHLPANGYAIDSTSSSLINPHSPPSPRPPSPMSVISSDGGSSMKTVDLLSRAQLTEKHQTCSPFDDLSSSPLPNGDHNVASRDQLLLWSSQGPDEEEWPKYSGQDTDDHDWTHDYDEAPPPETNQCPNVTIVDGSEFMKRFSSAGSRPNSSYHLRTSASLRGRKTASKAIRNKRDFISTLIDENKTSDNHNARFARSLSFNSGTRRNAAKTDTEKMIQYLNRCLRNGRLFCRTIEEAHQSTKEVKEELIARYIMTMNDQNGVVSEAALTDRNSTTPYIDLKDTEKVCHSARVLTSAGHVRRELRSGTPGRGSIIRRIPRTEYTSLAKCPHYARGQEVTGEYSVLETLCRETNASRAMWFDGSGRAYVSLATRYDPIKK